MDRFNQLPLIVAIILIALTGTGCNSESESSTDTPESTFKSLVTAIKNRDLETYTALWHPDRKDSEGQVSKLTANPSEWEELQSIFKGNHSITNKSMGERNGNATCKMEIESPEGEGGGIGGIMLMQVEGKWLMWTW